MEKVGLDKIIIVTIIKVGFEVYNRKLICLMVYVDKYGNVLC